MKEYMLLDKQWFIISILMKENIREESPNLCNPEVLNSKVNILIKISLTFKRDSPSEYLQVDELDCLLGSGHAQDS